MMIMSMLMLMLVVVVIAVNGWWKLYKNIYNGMADIKKDDVNWTTLNLPTSDFERPNQSHTHQKHHCLCPKFLCVLWASFVASTPFDITERHDVQVISIRFTYITIGILLDNLGFWRLQRMSSYDCRSFSRIIFMISHVLFGVFVLVLCVVVCAPKAVLFPFAFQSLSSSYPLKAHLCARVCVHVCVCVPIFHDDEFLRWLVAAYNKRCSV